MHHGVLNDTVAFLQKPFKLPVLAAKVRTVLDRDQEP
jgi:DNA-binding response OmpR family regulator